MKKIFTHVTILVLALSLFGCTMFVRLFGGDNDNWERKPGTLIDKQYKGIWYSERVKIQGSKEDSAVIIEIYETEVNWVLSGSADWKEISGFTAAKPKASKNQEQRGTIYDNGDYLISLEYTAINELAITITPGKGNNLRLSGIFGAY